METVENPQLAIAHQDISDIKWKAYNQPLFGVKDGVEIHFRDIAQGDVGDCYFLAALAEIAQHFPNHIRKLIQQNEDNTYTIQGIGNLDSFKIDNLLPYDQYWDAPVYANYPDGWVALLEKAYAYINSQEQLKGPDNYYYWEGENSYETIHAGYPWGSLTDLTGIEANSSNEATIDLLTKDRPTVVFKDYHAYSVVGYDYEQQEFTLFDPWNKTEIVPLAEIDGYGVSWIEPMESDLDSVGSHDFLSVNIYSFDPIKGGQGNDTLIGASANDTLDGGPDCDLILGREGDNTLIGGRGKDIIVGGRDEDIIQGSKGSDWLQGRKGKDLLIGGKGQDRLLGGSGSDRLIGSWGNDLLNGGAGKDKFQFSSYNNGADTIRDFETGLDRLRISETGFSERLDLGSVPESFYTSVANLKELDSNIEFGFVYDRSNGSVAFLDLDHQVSLTTIATLDNKPELAANHLRVF